MTEDITTVERKWELVYAHATGEVAGRFLSELRNKKFMGKECPSCRRVLVPPRPFCNHCYAPTTNWVEVGHEGTIEAFTITYVQFPGLPSPPYVLAYVRLDKATTALPGLVKGIDLSDPSEAAAKLRIGTRVRVIFKDQPEGRISDFWFVLI